MAYHYVKASLERYDHPCECIFVTKLLLCPTPTHQQASKSLFGTEQSK